LPEQRLGRNTEYLEHQTLLPKNLSPRVRGETGWISW
jgi:hypothetical protein